MSITTEECVKRAEECERLAGACIAEANRKILLYAAAGWRRMLQDVAAADATSKRRGRGDGLNPEVARQH
jgi:hypothetical protein